MTNPESLPLTISVPSPEAVRPARRLSLSNFNIRENLMPRIKSLGTNVALPFGVGFMIGLYASFTVARWALDPVWSALKESLASAATGKG